MSVPSNKLERDVTIDTLRFIGISLIILAHVSPPNILFNIRCFDVPLMLFVSGLSYANKDVKGNYSFFIHRFKRLLIPLYLFLSVYFALIFSLKYIFSIDFGITLQQMVESYLLINGIGYVWIIRIFLMVALLTPWLISFSRKFKSNAVFLATIFLLMLIQNILLSYNIGENNIIVYEFIYYAVGYSCLFLYGLRIRNMKNNILYYELFWGVIFIAYAYFIYTNSAENKVYHMIQINNYKSPPQLYYLVWGAFLSTICYIIIQKHSQLWLAKYKLFSFIGMNTIWIYLYHIPLIQITTILKTPWYIQYLVVYALAVTFCYIQVKFVKEIKNKYPSLPILKYLKG